jgi:hypothetical protein
MNERPGAHERGRLQEQYSWAERGSRRFERGGRSFLECEQIYSKVFSSDDEQALDDEETLDAEMRAQTVGEKEEEHCARARARTHIPVLPFVSTRDMRLQGGRCIVLYSLS